MQKPHSGAPKLANQEMSCLTWGWRRRQKPIHAALMCHKNFCLYSTIKVKMLQGFIQGRHEIQVTFYLSKTVKTWAGGEQVLRGEDTLRNHCKKVRKRQSVHNQEITFTLLTSQGPNIFFILSRRCFHGSKYYYIILLINYSLSNSRSCVHWIKMQYFQKVLYLVYRFRHDRIQCKSPGE